jgi:SAM-dependent methyltransferase
VRKVNVASPFLQSLPVSFPSHPLRAHRLFFNSPGRSDSVGVMTYDAAFFEKVSPGSTKAAEKILPLVWPLATPSSVVDLGCGNGAWLLVARSLGARQVLGIDGADTAASLKISSADFIAADLEESLPLVDRQFDLAMCMEVLEHISPLAAERVLDWLCAHSPLVLFSAALPFQGGVHHVNEDWLSNWIGRFDQRSFLVYDLIRPHIWTDNDIPVWYRQNVVVAARRDHPSLTLSTPLDARFADLIHPDFWVHRTRQCMKLRRQINRRRRRKQKLKLEPAVRQDRPAKRANPIRPSRPQKGSHPNRTAWWLRAVQGTVQVLHQRKDAPRSTPRRGRNTDSSKGS